MDAHGAFAATDERELSDHLGTLAGPPVITGTDRPRVDAWLEGPGASLPPIVSTAGLGDVISFRPGDLTIEVGAGMRIARLREIVEADGLWVPASGIGETRSVGGWVAAASPAVWDASHGPVRRQLLGCRVIAPDGTRLSWGRAVMKNVAGYDVPRLMAGSRGRLGVITRVILRLWPRPAVAAAWEIRGASHPLSLEAAGVDALGWTWDRRSGETVTAMLAGNAASVRRRASRLADLARSQGADVAESDPAASGAGMTAAAGERSSSVVYRLTPGRRYLPHVFRMLAGRPELGLDRIDAMPSSGTMLVRTADGSPGREGGDAAALAGILQDGPGGEPLPIAIERGGPAEHAAVDSLRATGAVEVERSIGTALGAWPRLWQSDYL